MSGGDLAAASGPARYSNAGWRPADVVVGRRQATTLRIADVLLMIGVFLSGHAVLKLGGLNFTVSDVFVFGAAAIYLGHQRFNLAPFGEMTPIWLLGLGAMLGGLFVSSVVYGDLLRWLDIGTQYAAAYYLVPVVLMAVDVQFAKRLIIIYVIGIVASELVGIYSYFYLTPAETGFLSPGFIAPNHRIGAMAGEPNPNGATIAFALAMLLYAWRKRMLSLKLVILFGVILLWGLLLSASVTGAVASVVCLTTALAITGLSRLLKVGLLIIIAVGLYLGSGAPIPQEFQKRVGTAVVTGDVTKAGTFVNRAELIEEAWGQTDKHVVLGMGADEYRDFSQYGQPVHNLHLLIWDEGGAFAYLGLLIMLGLMGIFALAGLREKREEAAMALAVVIVFLIYTMAIPHMYSRFWTLPVFLGLSTIYGRDMGRSALEAQRAPARRAGMRPLITQNRSRT
jgi:O-antigen ligase